LLRSGIGDPGELTTKGVTPIFSRPGVGRNLVDHCQVGFGWLASFVDETTPLLETVCRYTATGSHRFNDMQMVLFQTGQPPIRLCASLVKPVSVGHLALASPDPTVQPDLRLNLLSEPEDMRRMIVGFRLLGKLIALPRMAQIGSEQLLLTDDVEMVATEFARRLHDDAWIADYVHRTVRHYVHPVGTARMGRSSDPDAVVDQHGRVHGVVELRVADASIMPTIPSANTNFPCIMIGERIAKWMRNESD
jgi:choline dehydrogenase-like flavoprotein